MAKALIQRELKRNRVDVRAIEQQTYSIYNNDPNDFLVNGMLELLDQYQRLEIALKLSRGRRKKAEQGGYQAVARRSVITLQRDKRYCILTPNRRIRSDVYSNSDTNSPYGNLNKLRAN